MNEYTARSNKEISERFLKALEELKSLKRINYTGFCESVGANRFTLWSVRNGENVGSIEMSWLAYLITEHGVNAEWLMTGVGKMFTKVPTPKVYTPKKYYIKKADRINPS